MDYKEKNLYYFIQLELLSLKNLTKVFREKQSKALKITSSEHRGSMPISRSKAGAVNKLLNCSGK